MKLNGSIISALFIILIFATAATAIPTEPATKLERYRAQKDKLIISESHTLGEMKEPLMVFQAIIAYEPGISTKFGGIQVYTPQGQGMDYFFAYIDSDAVDELLKAVTAMIDMHKEKHLETNKSEKELLYSCKGGFTVRLRETDSKDILFIGGRHSYMSLTPPDLDKLRPILEKARDFLKQNNVTKIPDDKFPEVQTITAP
jgi:hypothetical protein